MSLPYLTGQRDKLRESRISFSDKPNYSTLSQDTSNNFRSNFSNKLQVNDIPERSKTFNSYLKIKWVKRNKNDAYKVNSRTFSLYYNYSYPLTFLNVGELSWSCLSSHNNKFPLCLFTSSIKREIKHFHVVVVFVHKRDRSVQKAWCTCKAVIFIINPIVLSTFSLPSASFDFKVPINMSRAASNTYGNEKH